jgi:opacity protein-like surface antigen
MKKSALIIVFVSLALTQLSINAFADETSSFYIEGLVGTPIRNLNASSDYAGASGYVCSNCPTGKLGDVNTSPGTTWGLKAGYKYTENLKFDLSYYSLSYGQTKWGTDFTSFNGTYNPATAIPFTSDKLTANVVFISAYYNLNMKNGFMPYVGAGIGYSRNKISHINEGGYNFMNSHTSADFAYKLDTGLAYQINKNISIDLGVSLIDVGEFESANVRGTNNEPIAPYKFSASLSPITALGLVDNF